MENTEDDEEKIGLMLSVGTLKFKLRDMKKAADKRKNEIRDLRKQEETLNDENKKLADELV